MIFIDKQAFSLKLPLENLLRNGIIANNFLLFAFGGEKP